MKSNLKFISLFLLTLLRKRRKVIFLGFLIIFFGLFLLFAGNKLFSKPKLNEGLVGTYQEHDLPETVTRLLSKGLVSIDETGKAVPNLLASWEIKDNGKLYNFILKDNISWVDGTPILASDIDLGIPDIELTYPNNKTIQVKLGDSFSPFPTLLTKPIFKRDSKIGLGPYKISKIQKDQVFIKKIYLKSDDITLPEVVVKFYPNEKIAKNALQIGEVSTLFGMNDLSEFGGDNTLKVSSQTNFQQIVAVFYNTTDKVLSDENFRLGLSFAAPSIIGETEAKTPIPPKSWVFNPEVKDYLDNPQQAKINLDKVESGFESTITLTATSSLQKVGQLVVEAWKKQGIKAVLRVESGIPQNFQALLIAHNIPADPDQYSLWHSTQKQTNISHLSDSRVSPRIDKDLEDGRKSTDPEVRKARYQDFQKVLLDHAPATFLYFPKYNVIYRKKAEKQLNKVINLQLPKQ